MKKQRPPEPEPFPPDGFYAVLGLEYVCGEPVTQGLQVIACVRGYAAASVRFLAVKTSGRDWRRPGLLLLEAGPC